MRANTFLTLVYPRLCPSCGEPHGPDSSLTADALCPSCADQLQPVTEPFCECCGEPFDGAISSPSFRCSNCAGRDFAFDFAISGYRAEGPALNMIHRFKYRREIQLARPTAILLADALEDPRIAEVEDWVLVPVPLHWRRRNHRGFNQAAELCRSLSKIANLQVRDALGRSRSTGHQAHLDRAARLENLRGSIRIRRFLRSAT